MITLRQAVIVEGRYDKIKLSGIVDALIIVTDGFQIFKNKERLELIRMMAKTRGIILLTDSDSAGFIIRNYLADAVREGEVVHAYIPEIEGRERRKDKPSAEGLLGVEGVGEREILAALEAAGVTGSERIDRTPVTKLMLYEDGFFGRDNSKAMREKLCAELGLPRHISSNMLPEVITSVCGESKYKQVVSAKFSHILS